MELRERVKDLLFPKVDREIKSSEREKLEKSYAKWRERYRARRSAEGQKYWGDDPDVKAKDEPFENCSDIGVPIEMQIIQELLPRVQNAHLGLIPFTESTRRSGSKKLPWGELDYFWQHELVDKAHLDTKRRTTLLASYKLGEMIEKPVLEEKYRIYQGKRWRLMNGDEPLKNFRGEVIEFGQEGFDLKEYFLAQCRNPESPYSGPFRQEMAANPNSTEESGLVAAGFEVKEKTVRVAPFPDRKLLESGMVVEAIARRWQEAKEYKYTEIKTIDKVVYDRGLTVIHVRPEDFVWPSNAKTVDVMDHWVCQRFWPTLDWLKQKSTEQGFFEERISRLIDNYIKDDTSETHNQEKNPAKDKTVEPRPEVWEVYDRLILNNIDGSKADYMKEIEVIAWFAPELSDDPLIGWMQNPNALFPIYHIRPFFVFQPKPEEGQVHGLCVPESCDGGRYVIDSVINSSLDRQALYTDPIIKMTISAFKRSNLQFGPKAKWIVQDMKDIEPVRLFVPERQSAETAQMLITWLRMLWGSSELMAGFTSKTTSRTLGEAELLKGLGSTMYYDTVESFAKVSDLFLKYVACLYQYSDIGKSIDFPLNDDSVQVMDTNLIDQSVVTKHRRVITETARQEQLMGLQQFLPIIQNMCPEMTREPTYVAEVVNLIRDLLNLESLSKIDPEKLLNIMQAASQGQENAGKLDRINQIIQSEQNKGTRNLYQNLISRASSPSGTLAPTASPANQSAGVKR